MVNLFLGWVMFKRFMDFIAALFLLLVLGIPIAVLALLVRWKLGTPVLFRQQRPGQRGQLFTMLKFRSMTDAYAASGARLPDSDRLTTFGRKLRRTSLDELPELWNVVRGDMSLVGPRPLLVEYLAYYTAEQSRRHEVRPGITGWSQVNGRNATDWETQFRQDVWYVDHRSWRLDLRILWLTIGKVLGGADVAQAGRATRDPFRGLGGARIGSDAAPDSMK